MRADELLAVLEGILPATAWQEMGESIDVQAAAVFDRSAALSYVDGDLVLLQEMAEAFLADYPPRLAEIQESITIGDSQALMRAAHSLKGGWPASPPSRRMMRPYDWKSWGAVATCRRRETRMRRLKPNCHASRASSS